MLIARDEEWEVSGWCSREGLGVFILEITVLQHKILEFLGKLRDSMNSPGSHSLLYVRDGTWTYISCFSGCSVSIIFVFSLEVFYFSGTLPLYGIICDHTFVSFTSLTVGGPAGDGTGWFINKYSLLGSVVGTEVFIQRNETDPSLKVLMSC